MQKNIIRIATRGSKLALWQARYVRQLLLVVEPDFTIEINEMTTQGDRIQDAPLAKIGGKGLFVKELEQALLNDRADIAVHSMKDVPALLPNGLHIPAILPREDPRDALVSNDYDEIDALPLGAKVGTSSLRRRCQLKRNRPDLNIYDLRGNVDTRLAKLDAGQYDAIILASAGLRRLGLSERIQQPIPPETIMPAIAQGAIGIECREGDEAVGRLLSKLNDPVTQIRVRAERAFNARLEGGCQVPIGGYAELEKDIIVLRGLVGSTDGSDIVQGVISGRSKDAEELGTVLAEDLLSRGAEQILADLYNEGE